MGTSCWHSRWRARRLFLKKRLTLFVTTISWLHRLLYVELLLHSYTSPLNNCYISSKIKKPWGQETLMSSSWGLYSHTGFLFTICLTADFIYTRTYAIQHIRFVTHCVSWKLRRRSKALKRFTRYSHSFLSASQGLLVASICYYFYSLSLV